MKVRDLIANKKFDVNCDYHIMKDTSDDDWDLFNSRYEDTPPKELMDAEITYLSVGDNMLVIEVKVD